MCFLNRFVFSFLVSVVLCAAPVFAQQYMDSGWDEPFGSSEFETEPDAETPVEEEYLYEVELGSWAPEVDSRWAEEEEALCDENYDSAGFPPVYLSDPNDCPGCASFDEFCDADADGVVDEYRRGVGVTLCSGTMPCLEDSAGGSPAHCDCDTGEEPPDLAECADPGTDAADGADLDMGYEMTGGAAQSNSSLLAGTTSAGTGAVLAAGIFRGLCGKINCTTPVIEGFGRVRYYKATAGGFGVGPGLNPAPIGLTPTSTLKCLRSRIVNVGYTCTERFGFCCGSARTYAYYQSQEQVHTYTINIAPRFLFTTGVEIPIPIPGVKNIGVNLTYYQLIPGDQRMADNLCLARAPAWPAYAPPATVVYPN